MATTITIDPAEIRRRVERGKQYEETLTVSNVSDERYTYRVEPDAEYQDWIDSDPDLFAINAHEERAIALNLQPPDNAKIGVHRFRVEVANDDAEDDLERVYLVLGVPIPLLWWVILAAVIVALLTILIMWAQRV
jgi:hypothetical protein